MGASSAAAPLTEAQAQFIEWGTSVTVAACDEPLAPSQARAVGCRVAPDRRAVTVFVRRSQSAALLADVARRGWVAVCFCQPSTHRTLQIKATDAALVEPDIAADTLTAQATAFCRELAGYGYAEAWTRALLGYAPADLVGIRFTPAAIFSQTPGPRAGERLA